LLPLRRLPVAGGLVACASLMLYRLRTCMCVFGVGGLSRRAARRVAGLAKRHAALLERAAKRREASTR
jgi:hypothetical protein